MSSTSLRYRCLASAAGSFAALALAAGFLLAAEDGNPAEQLTIAEGELKVLLRDNAQSPKVLSGLGSLFHKTAAPDFDAFDPDDKGSSAGLNFEHIISGHKNPNNKYTPRRGRYTLSLLPGGTSAQLLRRKEDEPWALASMLTYSVVRPNSIDVDFRCVPHDKALFGKRGHAILFFANYMNDVEDVALNFRGVEGPGQEEKWVKADAPGGHADGKQGGTYRSLPAADLEYDADHNFKLNSWSYDYPRFTKPFYYGRAARGMVFILMFNKMHGEEDEIRFSLFKFKVPRVPRPAWDFQYVLRKVEEQKGLFVKSCG